MSTLACYSPADSADDAEECSKLHYFAEKDMLMWFKRLLLFGFCLRLSARSAGDFGVSIEYSCVIILPQITQITQTNTTSCIISQRKTDCLRLMLFWNFGVHLRKSARSAGDIGGSFVRIV